MKTPFWMINSLLALLCLCALGFIMITQVEVPTLVSIEPEPASIVLPTKEGSKVQLSRIYNNDLFDTYIQVKPQPTVPPVEKITLPTPPTPKQFVPTAPPAPAFLAPLNITLKGIIWQGTEEESRTIIADQSGQQKVYRVGDKIEDSYLLHIFARRIILLRSNGQQEVLYLNKDDATAHKEKEIVRKLDYSKSIKQISSTIFLIDPDEFVKTVNNLGQVIDALNLSSVYQGGFAAGVRIGSFDHGTLGSVLGLLEDDVIIAINGIEATDIKKRLEIYNTIIELPIGSVIKVSLLRNEEEIVMYYRLQKIVPDMMQMQPSQLANKQQVQAESAKIGATRTQLKRADKQAMIKKGTRQPLFKTIS